MKRVNNFLNKKISHSSILISLRLSISFQNKSYFYKMFQTFEIFRSTIVINIIVIVSSFDRSFLKERFVNIVRLVKFWELRINVYIRSSRGFIIESLCYEIVRFAEFPPARTSYCYHSILSHRASNRADVDRSQ